MIVIKKKCLERERDMGGEREEGRRREGERKKHVNVYI